MITRLVGVALVVAALAPAESAPAAGSLRQAATATVVVDARANGTTIRLHPGDTLVVRLPGNPTTGYRWVVASRPAALRLATSRYATPTRPRLGQGGTYSFGFRARAGGGLLRLAYLRPWETRKPPLRTFTLTIRVR